jgi:hypothetical protein|eukprot:COSAG03_NODE_704_length_6188_cov_34.462309_4_plen_54_part_00
MELSSDVFDLGEAAPRMQELGRLQDCLQVVCVANGEEQMADLDSAKNRLALER